MKLIKAKTIITYNSSDWWFGCRYTMNIYRGCSHGCIYCDSRSDCYHIENFDEIVAKENAIKIIERELKGKRKTGIIGTGATSDPYNLYEEKYTLTRQSLELINRYQFGINITTKSTLVVRDIDILKKISGHSPVCIGVTITTPFDNISKIIEPGAPTSSQRFLAIERLRKEGIYTGITMMPILPFITDNEDCILDLVQKAKDSGANFIYPWFGVTLRLGQREFFYHNLDRYYPGLKDQYFRTYGDKYECLSPKHNYLWDVFKDKCEKYKIHYKMSDIIAGAKNNVKMKQLTFL